VVGAGQGRASALTILERGMCQEGRWEDQGRRAGERCNFSPVFLCSNDMLSEDGIIAVEIDSLSLREFVENPREKP
jgi:hypothetical protein